MYYYTDNRIHTTTALLVAFLKVNKCKFIQSILQLQFNYCKYTLINFCYTEVPMTDAFTKYKIHLKKNSKRNLSKNGSPEITKSKVIWIIHSINQLHRNRAISILIKVPHVRLLSNKKWKHLIFQNSNPISLKCIFNLKAKNINVSGTFASLKQKSTGSPLFPKVSKGTNYQKKENKPIEFNMRKQILQVFTTNVLFISFLKVINNLRVHNLLLFSSCNIPAPPFSDAVRSDQSIHK